MWNRLAIIIGITLGLITIFLPGQSFASHVHEISWQLVVISSEPACSGYHHYMVQKYNEITEKYLDLYQIQHSSYDAECYTDIQFIEEYEKPFGLDLLVIILDKDKGLTDLHSHSTGGIYVHQGNDLTRNHTVIICDCPNFRYSDPVWILSHELSHFVLNYLGFDLEIVEKEIHILDERFDRCVEGSYDNSCNEIKTKLETFRADWTVMIPYKAAIGMEPPESTIEKVSIGTTFQENMLKEITNWWLNGEISDKNFIHSLKILSGKDNDKKLSSMGIFKESNLLILAEPENDNNEQVLTENDSHQLIENFLNINSIISNEKTNFSSEDEEIFLEWLKTKASSWKSDEITDAKFVLEIEKILNSSQVNLYLDYLENLSYEELISKAKEYEKNGQYQNALSFYDLALIENIDSKEILTEALMGKAIILNNLRQYTKSIEYLDAALEFQPNNIELLKMKAFTMAQIGKLQEAKEHYAIAIQMAEK